MTLTVILFLVISTLLSMSWISHPISLGVMVVISSGALLMFSTSMMSSWYSYVLFLIYVGAVMIAFMYLMCLIPSYNNKSSMKLTWMMKFSLLIFMPMLCSYVPWTQPLKKILVHKPSNITEWNFHNSPVFPTLAPSFFLFPVMCIMLIACLALVVKINKKNEAPMRSFQVGSKVHLT